MEEKDKIRKKLRALMIIMVVIIIPGFVRTVSSPAFESVRSVDMVMLVATGIATGVLLVTARNYFRTKDE